MEDTSGDEAEEAVPWLSAFLGPLGQRQVQGVVAGGLQENCRQEDMLVSCQRAPYTLGVGHVLVGEDHD